MNQTKNKHLDYNITDLEEGWEEEVLGNVDVFLNDLKTPAIFGLSQTKGRDQQISFPGVSVEYPQIDFQNKKYVRIVSTTGTPHYEYYSKFNKTMLEKLEESGEKEILSIIFGCSPSRRKHSTS